jgi:large subunit ribosomal protein L31
MQKEKHPEYRDVLFVDTSTGVKFVVGSTIATDAVETFEGRELPMVQLPVSSASHPFYTGSNKFVDTEGRVDKFNKRYGKKS